MDDQFYRKTPPRFDVVNWLKKKLKKRNFLISLVILVPALSFVTFSSRGIVARATLASEKEAMQLKVTKAQEEQRQLQQQSKALENDPKAIEKVAREKYGMVRKGETVYKVRKGEK